MPPDRLQVVRADLDCPTDQADVLAMVDAYAADPMAAGKPLSPEVRGRLVAGLRAHPTTEILLARLGEEPIGVAVCFVGFSTFAARPLLNVHDLSVVASQRGRGVGRQLLEAAECRARVLGCCKITLEVLEQNPARLLYERAGFSPVSYGDASAGCALFLAKSL